jgi:hypothetical protein
MKEVYPEYADQVAFYAVGSDPTEDLALLEEFASEQEYPWPVAKPVGAMLQDLEVLLRSTKIAFDANGVIIYRASYDQGGPEDWRQVFQELADSQ